MRPGPHLYWPRRACVERHSRRRVGGGGGRRGRPARPPPGAPPAPCGDRHGRRGAACPVRGGPALPRPRRRDLHAADVCLRRDLPDAQRRPGAPSRARAGDLSGEDRSRPRARRAARPAAAARARSAGRDRPRRPGARVVALDLVLCPPRDGGVPAPAPARAVPARRGADVRRLRHRRDRLLGDPDRPAVVRRRAGRPGPWRPGPAAHDARARGGVLEGRLGASLRCPWRQSARRHALAALRDIPDGRAPAARGRPRAGRGGVDVCDHARLRARLPRRALRRRPDRRRGAHRVDPARGAARGARGARPEPGAAATRTGGPGMRRAPVDEPNPTEREREQDEEMPSVGMTRKRFVLGCLLILGVVALLYYGVPRLAGLDATWHRIEQGDPWWLGLALAFCALSFGGYVVLLRYVFAVGGARLGVRESYEITMASLAATRIFAAGGAGGIALTAWAMRRAGMAARTVAERTMVFLVLTYVVYMAVMLVTGVLLRVGVLPGAAPFGLTVVPAVFAGIAILLTLLLSLTPTDLRRRVERAAGGEGRLAPVAAEAATLAATMSAAVRPSIDHLRGRDPAILGSIAYWGFNVGVLWASFRAFGEAPPWSIVVMGYFVGMLGNLLPLPGGVGGVDGGMIGAFIGFGVDSGLAVVAVLTYRAIAFWLPTIPGAIAFFQLRRTVARWREEREGERRRGATAVARAGRNSAAPSGYYTK